jgi:hypothetical protein
MQRAIRTPNIGNGSSAQGTIVVGRVCQPILARHGEAHRIAVLRFQLVFRQRERPLLMIAAVGLSLHDRESSSLVF